MFRNRCRPLTVELLEPRRFLAGNVLAAVSAAGDLTVTGDDSANALRIVPHESSGAIVPSFYQISPADGTTTINGVAGPVLVGNVTGGFSINLKGGDDRLLIGDAAIGQLTVPGPLMINTAAGDDFVLLYATQANGGLKAVLGIGADKIALMKSRVVGKAEINTGAADLAGAHDHKLTRPCGRGDHARFDCRRWQPLDCHGHGERPRFRRPCSESHEERNLGEPGGPCLGGQECLIWRERSGHGDRDRGVGDDMVGFEKSTVALDAVFSMGAGTDWLGLQDNTAKANISAYGGDGDDYMAFRRNQVTRNVLDRQRHGERHGGSRDQYHWGKPDHFPAGRE